MTLMKTYVAHNVILNKPVQCPIEKHAVWHRSSGDLRGFQIQSHTSWTACLMFTISVCYYSKLLHRANLQFVYVCFPMGMGSCEGGHMWAQLQSAEPWSQSPHCCTERFHFFLNVFMLNMTSVQVAQNSTLDNPGSSATKLPSVTLIRRTFLELTERKRFHSRPQTVLMYFYQDHISPLQWAVVHLLLENYV